MVSPHDVLMVDEDAGEDEIEEAYRERIKQTHPDQGGSPEQFQLVKSAYQEIQSGRPTENRSSSSRERSGTEDGVRCSKCNSVIQDMSKATYRQETEGVFCPDCVVETYCRSCGEDLLLTMDQFAAVDGEPICGSCNQQRQNMNHQSTRASNDQSDSIHPLWIFGAMVAISCAVVWYLRPTIVVSPEAIDTARNIIRAAAGPGILILLWAIWKE